MCFRNSLEARARSIPATKTCRWDLGENRRLETAAHATPS